MRKLGAWGLEVALVTALSATQAGAGEDVAPWARSRPGHSSGGLVSHLFGAKEKSVPKKSTAEPSSEAVKKVPAPAKPPSQVDGATAERRREEASFLRRDAICDRLLEIAVQTEDLELLRRAEQLRERSWATYSQRTAHLPGARGVFESDEQILEQHLGSGRATGGQNELTPSYTVKGTDGSSHSAVKEETP